MKDHSGYFTAEGVEDYIRRAKSGPYAGCNMANTPDVTGLLLGGADEERWIEDTIRETLSDLRGVVCLMSETNFMEIIRDLARSS
jgi:hypothetical protein